MLPLWPSAAPFYDCWNRGKAPQGLNCKGRLGLPVVPPLFTMLLLAFVEITAVFGLLEV